jgi:hypothetical protein
LPVTFEICDLNIPQGVGPRQMLLKEFHSNLTVGSTAVVFPQRQFMLDHAVTDHQPDVSRQWKQLIFQGAAIEHESMSGNAKARDELIHDAATRSNVFVFGFLAQLH